MLNMDPPAPTREIVCVHDWSDYSSRYALDGLSTVAFKKCERCKARWIRGAEPEAAWGKEPRVVIGRME